MNRNMVFYMSGRILQIEAALFLLPIIVSLIYKEGAVALSFLAVAAGALGIGFLLTKLFRRGDRTIFAKEGFVIVALAWVIMSVVGALPFVISGDIPSYVDALFETISGFTTTGASVLTNVEALSHGSLIWRSFTHWVGGMGVLVFIMAIFPSESGRSIHIMRAEMPGPIVGKILPKIRETAKILYIIYIALTLVGIIVLWFGEMNLFESAVHMIGTAGTGGFGIKSDSLAGYSAYSQWVITIFMWLFGINFNLYFLVLIGRVRSALKSSELWCYIAVTAVAATIVAINIYPLFENIGETIRHSAFQITSIITTTGFATADFNLWPQLSKTIILILMFMGGCAGSTAGGLKVSRIMLIFKSIRRDLKHLIHPRSVGVIKMEGKKIEETTINGLGVYLSLYFVIFLAVILLLSFEPFDFETIFTATASCINNIGPGLSGVGPMAGFAGFSVFSKLILSVTMLLGRLELYPLLLAIIPSTWMKKG